MRGIVFTGGRGPSSAFCRSVAGEADVILAADSGLEAAEAAGIRPDWIIGDMDSLDNPGRLEKYPTSIVRRYPCDKDYTDTELGLIKLWEEGCDEIWISGGGGGRIDHLFGIRSLFERDRPPDRWITETEDIICLKPGAQTARTIVRGDIVSVFPLSDAPWEAESSGLKWPLNGLAWNHGSIGVSNVAETGEFTVRSIRGRFMIITCLLENL